MRYAVFRIPRQRVITRGGWDDLFCRCDTLEDAKNIVARDPRQIVARAFPDQALSEPVCSYQIVDTQTGEIVFDSEDPS